MEKRRVYYKGKICNSRNCGRFELVEYLGNNRWKIRFVDTKYETEAYQSNIKAGRVMDRTLEYVFYKYKTGDKVKTYDGSEVVVKKIKNIEKGNRRRTYLVVEFIKSGYITECTPDNLTRKGKIKDYYSPTVHGVGILGDVNELVKSGMLKNMSEYRIWASMIKRCYQSQYKINKSYEEVTVCDRWKRFDYFYEDIKKIEGYDKWKKFKEENPKIKNEYEFDKDTLILGSKIYSPETCRFIHKSINAGFTSWACKETKQYLLHRLDKMNGVEA